MSNSELSYKVYEGAKVKNSHIGNDCVIGEYSYVEACTFAEGVQLNRRNFVDNSNIGKYSYTGMNTVIKHADIGCFCSISWNVSITGNLHNYNCISPHPFTNFKSFGFVNENEPLDKSKVIIGNDVWIGMNSCILPGVSIGNGAVIGAGSVVTKDVPPYAIVVGNPAKVLKYRFDEKTISLLQEVEWWNWPEDVLKSNIEMFRENLTEEVCKKIKKIHNKLTVNQQKEV